MSASLPLLSVQALSMWALSMWVLSVWVLSVLAGPAPGAASAPPNAERSQKKRAGPR